MDAIEFIKSEYPPVMGNGLEDTAMINAKNAGIHFGLSLLVSLSGPAQDKNMKYPKPKTLQK